MTLQEVAVEMAVDIATGYPSDSVEFIPWYMRPGVQAASAWNPIIGISTILYLPVVFYLKRYYADRNPFKYNSVLITWNLILSLLSLIGSLVIICLQPDIIFKRTVDPRSFLPPVRHVIALFCVTKFLEYGDTIFLAIKKRPTIFLHLYHHVTVTIYCWHSLYAEVDYGHLFAFVNLNIHAIMYLYYASAIMFKKNKFLAACRPWITFLQTAQMFLGIYLSYKALTDPTKVDVQQVTNAIAALVMYISYAYLFASFFILNYSKKCDLDSMSVVTCLMISAITTVKLIKNLVFWDNGSSTDVGVSSLISVCCTVLSFVVVHLLCSPYTSSVDKYKYSSPVSNLCTQADAVVLVEDESRVVDRTGYKIFVKKYSCSYHSRIIQLLLQFLPVPLLSLVGTYYFDGSYNLTLNLISSMWCMHGYKSGMFTTLESRKIEDSDSSPTSADTSKVLNDATTTLEGSSQISDGVPRRRMSALDVKVTEIDDTTLKHRHSVDNIATRRPITGEDISISEVAARLT